MTDNQRKGSLSDHVKLTLSEYFNALEGEEPCDLHGLTIRQVEKPLIEFVLDKYGNNQTKASDVLGINRNTLRKKIKQYQIKTNP